LNRKVFGLEESMHDYEIRVLNENLRTAAFIETLEASDDAAIRSAIRIANGRAVEVWRDIECLYRMPPGTPSAGELAA
jgi:hypothetical protein